MSLSPTSSSFPGSETIQRWNETVSSSVTKFNTNHPLVSKVTLSVLALVFVLYASMAAPKLPASMLSYFDYPLVKLVFMFLIAFLAVKDFGTALIVSMALLGTLMALKYYNTNSHLPSLPSLPSLSSLGLANGSASQSTQSGMCASSPNTNEMNMVPQQNVPDCVYASSNPNSSAPSPSENSGPVTGDASDANLTAGSVVSGFQGDDYCAY
jgi:hypothetical protein